MEQKNCNEACMEMNEYQIRDSLLTVLFYQLLNVCVCVLRCCVCTSEVVVFLVFKAVMCGGIE